MINEFVKGKPKAQPRPRATRRGGYVGIYNPTTASDWKGIVKAAFAKHKGSFGKDEPLLVTMAFTFARPPSHFKKSGGYRKGVKEYHTQKPDVDNIAKAVMDAIGDVKVWHDDCQVVRETTSKTWVDDESDAGCFITIEKYN